MASRLHSVLSQFPVRGRKAGSPKRARRNRDLSMGAGEHLEPRAMLAITATYDIDFVETNYITATRTHVYSPAAAAAGTVETNGALVLTIDDAGDRLFMRVKSNNYEFSTDSNFSTLIAMPNGLTNVPTGYAPFSGNQPLVDDDPTTVANEATFVNFQGKFNTIVVRASGIDAGTATGPTFEVVGGSQNVAKTLIVDLRADDGSPLSQSSIRIGAPVVVPATGFNAEFSSTYGGGATRNINGVITPLYSSNLGGGDVYFAAESVTISSSVTSNNDVYIDSAIGDNTNNPGNPTGVAVNANIVAPGTVDIGVSGGNIAAAGFSLKTGSEIGNNGANSAGFTLALQNANAVIGGNVRAVDHFITFEDTAAGVAAQSMSLTTQSSTGSQTGRLFGNTMVLYLNNDVADGAFAPGSVQDGLIDIRTKVADLRVTAAPQTGAATPLNYAIKVRNNADLALPAVIASNGTVDIGTTDAGNDVTLSAAIDTFGNFSLSSDADLVVTNPINSAKNIVLSAGRAKNGLLTAINGSITINAPVTSTSALGGTNNAITLSSVGGNVNVNELVESTGGDGVVVTTTGAGQITTQSFARNDPNSRLAGSSLTLSAGGGINVGTQTASLSASVTGAGDLVITNDGNQGNLLVTKAQTTSGSISLTAQDTIVLQANSVLAGGDPTAANATLGDVTIASTRGSIDLSAVTIQASKNTVTLSQGSFDTDGVTPLGNSTTGQILGAFPVKASALVYSSFNAPQNSTGTGASYVLFNNVPTISASLLQAGALAFTAANGYASTVPVTLKALSTFDGDITVTNTGVGLTATSVVANSEDGNLRNVSLSGKSLVLGSVVAEGGSATLTSQFGITDDGNAATTSVVADTVTLTAGQTLQGDIGTVASPVALDAFTSGGTVSLTASNLNKVGSIFASSNAAVDLVDVQAINQVSVDATADASSDVTATLVYANDDDGTVVLRAGRDLTAFDIQTNQGGGVLGNNSKITLAAGRNLIDPGADIDLVARSVSLSADSLTAFGFTALDTPTVVGAAATNAVQGDVTLDFDRAADVILDGVSTVNGNVTVTNVSAAAGFVSVGTNGVTANGAGRSISIDTTGGGTASIGFDPQLVANAPATQTQGRLTTAGSITLTSGAAIDVITAGVAGQTTAVQATSANGDIDLVHAVGNLSVATGGTGINAQAGAANVSLAVTNGSVVASTGVVTASLAAISASQNVDVRTLAGSLAVQGGGNVTVQQNAPLSLATGTANDKTFSGIASTGAAGAVSLTANGLITGGGLLVGGNSVSIVQQMAATAIDLDTAASVLSASAGSGAITLRNTKTFAIGAAGINAGAGASNVTLSAQAATGPKTAAITAGTGTITGNAVSLTAEGGVAAKTNATTLTVLTTGTVAGDVNITQQGQQNVTLTSISTSNGGVTVTSNKQVTVTSVVATGSAKNVSIATTGAGNAIILSAGSIIADADRVTLTATGAVDGTDNTATADISAVTADVRSGSVVLSAGATSEITVQASNVQGATSAGNLKVTMLKTTTKSLPVVLGKATGQTLLSAAGTVTIRTGQDLAVVDAPTAAGLSYRAGNTGTGVVNFVANNSLGAGAGSFAQALTNSGANVNGGATGRVIFSTAVTSPVQLANTVNFTSPVNYNGRNRLNLATGAIQTGNVVDIDGSRLAANTDGFNLAAGAAGSTISGFAFYGFSGTGAGVKISAGNGNTIQGNLFGITSSGRAVSNGFGVRVSGGTGHTISGNTVVRGTTAGISVEGGSATISNNNVGTNASRVNLANAIGIDITGGTGGSTVSNNVVGFNTTAGIRLNNAVGTAFTAGNQTVVSGNDVFLNATGILVNGTTAFATLTGNSVTRSTGVGVEIGGTANNVTLGGAAAANGNFIGTNANRALGIGNSLSGVLISSTGANNTVRNNTIMGNGTSTLAANAQNRAGIRISAATPATLNIADNKIEQNRGSGVLVDNASGALGTIQRNLFAGNGRWGVNTNGVGVTLGSAGNVNTYRTNAFGTFTVVAANGQG